MIDITEFIKKDGEERRQHLQLGEPCCERGGVSTNHKGVLAQYLDTTNRVEEYFYVTHVITGSVPILGICIGELIKRIL